MFFAPCHPYQRTYTECYRFRGIDPGTLSGRQIVECRERDLEKYAKELVETELLDPARTGIRGATVHGHSLRLAENGMMFDMLQRSVLGEDGIVRYVKNQIGEPLDRPVVIGKPMDENWLKEHTTIFHSLGGTPFRDDAEYIEHNLGTFQGRPAIHDWIVDAMAPFPNMTFSVDWHVIEGDRVAFYIWNHLPDPAGAVRSARGLARVAAVSDLLSNSDEPSRDPSRPWLLAPNDLQAIKVEEIAV